MKKLHGWQTATIGEVATITGGSGFPDTFQGESTGDLPFIKVSDLNLPGNEKYVNRANNWVSEEVRRLVKAKLQPSGAIVFAKVGGALLTNKRRILTRPTIIDNNMMALHATGVDEQFLYQFMLSVDLARYCQEGAVPSVNGSRVAEIVIDLPPLPEQRKIADILTTWDEALEKLDALIAAQDRRKKGLMQRLLTGRQRLGGMSKPWRRIRFSELLEPQDRYVEFDDEHNYSLVSIRRRSGGVFFREALNGSDIKTKVMKRVHTSDFLISRMQVVHGALGMVRPECDGMYASDSYDVLVARNADVLHMPFLDWLSRLPSFWHLAYISSHGVHIEKMTFKLSDFMHEKISIPNDINEQRQIATILDTADQHLSLLRAQRATLDRQKRGLMQRLLTGKTRVKTN